MYKTLLPPSASKIEKAYEHTTRYTDDLNVFINDVFIAQRCPPDFLPFLAWMLSISDEEGWVFAESIEAKRRLIERSVDIHKKKGTVWSIREVFRMLNLGEIEIIENIARLKYDGVNRYNDQMLHGDTDNYWATYIVRLKVPITNDQSLIIRKILDGVAPARSELVALDFKEVAIRYNNIANYNGQYNYGSA